MVRLSAACAKAYGIEAEKRRLYRRPDHWKLTHGVESDEPALFRIETVRIANGEDVGVLVAVDAATLRAAGENRLEAKRRDFVDSLAASFATMLDSEGRARPTRPRSGPPSMRPPLRQREGRASYRSVDPAEAPRRRRRTDLRTRAHGARGRRIVVRPNGRDYEILRGLGAREGDKRRKGG